MLHKRKTSIATLALLFALAVAPKSLATSRWASNSNPESHPTRGRTATASMKESGRSGNGKLVVRGGEGGDASVPTSVLWPNWNLQSPQNRRLSVDAIAPTASVPEGFATGFSVADSRLETFQGKSIESTPSDSGVMPPPIPVWLLTILPAAALLGVLLWWVQRDDGTPKSTMAEKQDLPESSQVEEPENWVCEPEPEPLRVRSANPPAEKIPPSPSPETHQAAIETSESEKTDITDIQDSDDTFIQDSDDTSIQDPETLTVSEIAEKERVSAELPPMSEVEKIDRPEIAIAKNSSITGANVTSTTTEPSPDIAQTDMQKPEPEPETQKLESFPVTAETDMEKPKPEPEPPKKLQPEDAIATSETVSEEIEPEDAIGASETVSEEIEPELAEISKQTTLTGGQAWVVGAGDDRGQLDVESKKFNVGQEDDGETLGIDVDRGLPELPEGYNRNCIVFMPRDPNWAYAYWDIGNEHREPLRKKGGKQLALRVYDVTWIDMDQQRPHSMKQYECDELAREWHIPIPMSDRDYIVEIGYITESGYWLVLSRSESVHIPPIYPCDHYGDRFYTIPWEEDLRGKTI
ncbi:DUF4912 domain-containing protein [Lyngbya sp. CCY1209]|uniref:DUF4912 domain-containing protein n=1 Tax=Lyngbya sp. CCY1209 TaxID=2886103 RepID=UPI002D20E096|nr:DUF4912 domain-containing protein [Lyngbya sp. CCY1209]MEB3886355.1 DUF4912 domain-containing protein [Lyngbya sp. CCY1209]